MALCVTDGDRREFQSPIPRQSIFQLVNRVVLINKFGGVMKAFFLAFALVQLLVIAGPAAKGTDRCRHPPPQAGDAA